MRINHNIPALNAYRNLTSTQNANSKSMEKLSSGLRINRAADDAAGLAISEGMKSQIQGLNQASRNSQDAISLLQTAEGGLTETHSILQRMNELAVQASNDTYTANDRMEMQKEVDQLKDEVDRIANTTSFNNKNLLDGSASAITSSDKLTTKVIMRGGLRNVDQFGRKSSSGGDYKLDISATAGTAQIQKTAIFKNAHAGDAVQNLSIDSASGIEHISATDIAHGAYQVQTSANQAIAATAIAAVSLGQYAASASSTAGSFMTAAVGFATNTAGASLNTHNASILMEVTSVGYAADGITATSIGLSVSWYEYDKSGKYLNTNGTYDTTQPIKLNTASITLNSAALLSGYSGVVGTGGVSLTFDITETGVAIGDKATLNFQGSVVTGTADQITLKNSTNTASTTYTNTVVDWKFQSADSFDNKTTDLSFFSLDTSGNASTGKVSLSVNGLGTSTTHSSFTYEEGLGKVASLDTKLSDIDRFWNASGKFLLDDPQTITLVQGNGQKTSVTLFNTDTIKDVREKLNSAISTGLGQGDLVTGTEQDNFASYVTKPSGNVESEIGSFVLRSAQAGDDGVINVIGNEAIVNALGLNNIQEATESKFQVSVTDAHDTTNVIAKDVQISGNTLIGVVNSNVDVKFDTNADINVAYNSSTKKFDLTGDTSNTYSTFVHLVDNSQVFQIGANQMQDMGAAIGQMDSTALGVNNILITDRNSAAKAITTINDAVTRVSAQRASIGAVQNRLEHTINNLGVAGENLTSAQSRIQDVDMAAEMMEFSKTNILAQASTAMLAQANQQPQNVLKLIG